VGGICGKYLGENFDGEVEERYNLEDFCLNGRIILNDFQDVGWRCNLY
jgi:hypothetical protein